MTTYPVGQTQHLSRKDVSINRFDFWGLKSLTDETPPIGDYSSTIRRTVLITHANPEDNLIARWLATRLMAAGYQVWVDVRSLRGGNDFWNVIEEQLRHHTIKQIVLVSGHMRKPGVQKELAMGDHVGRLLGDPDFMIPIRVADIPFGEFPPELFRRNAFDAFPNWATALSPLLETLSDAKVPRASHTQGELLGEIISAQEAGRLAILDQPETLLTNWFEIEATLPMLRFFGAKGTSGQIETWLNSIKLPYIQHSGLIGTFCDPATFSNAGDSPPTLDIRFRISFENLIRGREVYPFQNRADARRNVTNLLRQHWDAAMSRRGLVSFEYASGHTGWFFPDGLVSGPVKLQLADGRRVNRVVTGKFKERRWHLCLVAQPRLWPRPLLRIHANVALSLDGQTPLPGDQTQKVRLRLTRSWWNNKWRDLLLAGVGWLAEGDAKFSLGAGDELFKMNTNPISVNFPKSYRAEETRAIEENESGEVLLSDDLELEDDMDLGGDESEDDQ